MTNRFLFIIFASLLVGSSQYNGQSRVPNIKGKFLKGDSSNLRELAKGKVTLVKLVFKQIGSFDDMTILDKKLDKMLREK